MMREVKDIQDKLRSHVKLSFLNNARSMALSWNLTMPGTGMAPLTLKDFGQALGALKLTEGSIVNETIVYMVCHHFHHQRQWLSDTVDAWLAKEKMRVVMPDDGTDKKKLVDGRVVQGRESHYCRGGFGAFARHVKAEIVKGLMRNMLAGAGWCIATKDNSKQDQKGKKYEPINIQLQSTLTTHKCYRVTWVSDAGKAKEVQLKNNGVKLQEAIDWGGYLCHHLGAQLTESELHDLWRNYKQLPQTDARMKPPPDANRSPNTAPNATGAQSSAGPVDNPASISQVQVNNSGVPPTTAQPRVNTTAAHQSFGAMSQVNISDVPPTTHAGTQPQLNTTAAHQSFATMFQVNNSGASPTTAGTQPQLNTTAAHQSYAAMSEVNNSGAPPLTSTNPHLESTTAALSDQHMDNIGVSNDASIAKPPASVHQLHRFGAFRTITTHYYSHKFLFLSILQQSAATKSNKTKQREQCATAPSKQKKKDHVRTGAGNSKTKANISTTASSKKASTEYTICDDRNVHVGQSSNPYHTVASIPAYQCVHCIHQAACC